MIKSTVPKRKFSKTWEKDPELSKWVRPDPDAKDRAICLYCSGSLRAHHADLIHHAKSVKHQSNQAKYLEGEELDQDTSSCSDLSESVDSKLKENFEKWKKEPRLKDWIQIIENRPNKVHCTFCKVFVKANHFSLIAHRTTQRHMKIASIISMNIIPKPKEEKLIEVEEMDSTELGKDEYEQDSMEIYVNLRDDPENWETSSDIVPKRSFKKIRSKKWGKYGRRYCKSWEKDLELKTWIRPIASQPDKALCLYCKKALRAHHSDLIQHVKTSQHQRNEKTFESFIQSTAISEMSLVMQEDDEAHPEVIVNLDDNLKEETENSESSNYKDFVQFGILTISDSCWKSERVDESGNALEELINSGSLPFGGVVFIRQCVSDDINHITSILQSWTETNNIDVILTTGGTGFTDRDVTPEATQNVIEKLAPAVSTAMTISSLNQTPMAMLSRSICGIKNRTLIVNLPGSKKAVLECMKVLAVVLKHAVDQLKGNGKEVARVHTDLGGAICHSSYLLESPSEGERELEQTKVAKRHRICPYPKVSMEYAMKLIHKEAVILGVELLNLKDCLGHFLVNNVISNVNLPQFEASIKDGYAVLANDGVGRRRVKGAMAAGAQPDSIEVTPGTCVRISTGAPIPPGADAVVQVEDTQLLAETKNGGEEFEINIMKAPSKMQDIRPIGFDLQCGTMVLERHTFLGSTELALLASVGKSNATVFKKPIVGILSTGSELQAPGQLLKPGCIWDSNKIALMGLLREHNFTAIDLGVARDRTESLVERLTEGFEKCNVLVTSGGVSMGEKDLMKQVLTRYFQAKVHFAQLFMKPGKPTTFTTCKFNEEKKLIFALPGNPVSAMVTFQLLVLPALLSMSGDLSSAPNTLKVQVKNSMILDARPEYMRVKLESAKDGHGPPIATTTGNQMSSRLLSMCKADALLVLPARCPDKLVINEGELVDAIMIRPRPMFI